MVISGITIKVEVFNFCQRLPGKLEELNLQALKLLLERMGFRAIGLVLEVSNVTVLNWLRAYRQQTEQLLDQQPVNAVKTAELDELHTYFRRKKLLLALVCRRPGKKAVLRGSSVPWNGEKQASARYIEVNRLPERQSFVRHYQVNLSGMV